MTGIVFCGVVQMKTMGNEKVAALEKAATLQKDREDSLPQPSWGEDGACEREGFKKPYEGREADVPVPVLQRLAPYQPAIQEGQRV